MPGTKTQAVPRIQPQVGPDCPRDDVTCNEHAGHRHSTEAAGSVIRGEDDTPKKGLPEPNGRRASCLRLARRGALRLCISCLAFLDRCRFRGKQGAVCGLAFGREAVPVGIEFLPYRAVAS